MRTSAVSTSRRSVPPSGPPSEAASGGVRATIRSLTVSGPAAGTVHKKRPAAAPTAPAATHVAPWSKLASTAASEVSPGRGVHTSAWTLSLAHEARGRFEKDEAAVATVRAGGTTPASAEAPGRRDPTQLAIPATQAAARMDRRRLREVRVGNFQTIVSGLALIFPQNEAKSHASGVPPSGLFLNPSPDGASECWRVRRPLKSHELPSSGRETARARISFHRADIGGNWVPLRRLEPLDIKLGVSRFAFRVSRNVSFRGRGERACGDAGRDSCRRIYREPFENLNAPSLLSSRQHDAERGPGFA